MWILWADFKICLFLMGAENAVIISVNMCAQCMLRAVSYAYNNMGVKRMNLILGDKVHKIEI